MNDNREEVKSKLSPYMTPLGTWAFSIGTSIGWGSFVVTCSTYLNQAGVLGTILGLIIGMLVVFIITKNLCAAMERNPDAGGIYTFVRSACGYDHGFLIAWFLLLTYLAILWANITSLPLFARRFMGGMFRTGFLYNVFGYDVYIGEILLCIAALAVFALLCSKSTKIPQIMMIIMAVIFVGTVIVCAAIALLSHNGQYSYDPMFIADRSQLSQIVRIAVISPWAFIGFENVAHFSEEFTYPVKKIKKIVLASVIFTTLVYILMTLLSVTAYPAGYSDWLSYIKDMDNLSGIESIPAFYAASVYLGQGGITMMMLALLSVVITSIIANLTALSRLIFALGRDRLMPSSMSETNSRGIPHRAIMTVFVISLFIPFLGRTAIGWIVDVTTLGATILYGFLSYALFKDARKRADRTETITGAAGSVIMIGFVILLLAPKIMSYEAMPSESYLIFAVWALLGLIVFRFVMSHDDSHAYGHSVVVWMLFLLLMLLTTMMWVSRITQNVTESSINEIQTYYEDHITKGGSSAYDLEAAEDFLREHAEKIESTDSKNTIFAYGLFILAVAIMLNNFRISKNREREWQDLLGEAQQESNTDPLTGVKNRHAFFRWADDIDGRIVEGDRTGFAVVVCDINDLKKINDSLGHAAGDECIRKASAKICRIFSHSPVFRYGGDEFVVILEGEDYDRNEELMNEVEEVSNLAKRINENTIAAGIALFEPDRHKSMLAVFEEADTAMYEKKRKMKGITT